MLHYEGAPSVKAFQVLEVDDLGGTPRTQSPILSFVSQPLLARCIPPERDLSATCRLGVRIEPESSASHTSGNTPPPSVEEA
jgi:hypothetical protein